MNHTDYLAPYSGVVGQHEMNSTFFIGILFYFICLDTFVLLVFVCLFVCFDLWETERQVGNMKLVGQEDELDWGALRGCKSILKSGWKEFFFCFDFCFMACDILAYLRTRTNRRTGSTQCPRIMKKEGIKTKEIKNWIKCHSYLSHRLSKFKVK